MRKLPSFLMLFILLTFLACTGNPDSQPMNQPVPFLKERILLNNGEITDIEMPIIYKDLLLILNTNYDTGKGWINAYDKNTLEKKWTWQKAYDDYGAKGFGLSSYVSNDILCIAESNLSYGINVDSGQTIWENRDNTGQSYINGINEIITSTSFDEFNEDANVRVANINTGEWARVFEKTRDDSLLVQLKTAFPIEWQGKEYVTFVSTKWGTSPSLAIYWLHLYNLTEGQLEWTSDTIPLEFILSGTPGVRPSFHDGQILLSNDAIYSYNIEDGSLEWSTYYGNSFISGGLVCSNGLVYANNESSYFVGLDVHTGQEKFNVPSGGTPSRIVYNDNKCYMSQVTTGGPSHLMIFDGQNGDKLIDVTAPFQETSGAAKEWFYDSSIAVDSETGLVYTSDHKFLLIYDFEL